ncbi:MAG: hypothetical protein CMB99_16115 [Flavobacteriaceae bacterium]|jgi:hypothetical protein|nr:hypothetical protein [Flavobacteriaceae bacterium]|tara:strand:+ start:32255 stop:32581 length:327 start_codon:yes stop_codon:yes gene_type:complete
MGARLTVYIDGIGELPRFMTPDELATLLVDEDKVSAMRHKLYRQIRDQKISIAPHDKPYLIDVKSYFEQKKEQTPCRVDRSLKSKSLARSSSSRRLRKSKGDMSCLIK